MMNDCKQLLEALRCLDAGEPFEININIPVSGKSYFQCVQINRDIVNAGQQSIAFDDRLIYPHVTLKMGCVLNGQLDGVLNELDSYFKTVSCFELTPRQVILKQPQNNYYFAEIFNERLMSISSDLNKLLEGKMQAHRFTLSKDNLHHITLGYKFSRDQAEDVLGRQIDAFIADRIAVSISGKFGVCLGSLKTYHLNLK